ncbi:hypothetical protein M422DRAFT_63455 [Sphaerobolus stellatus SS14]|nr:hypothetical protein M422DRAFT_63455 [Sphaerobolus stellatus SS14]
MSTSAKNAEAFHAPQVVQLSSRHSAFISISLSRYKRQWFLTYPRAYGMTDPPGQRILCSLNVPDPKVTEIHAKRYFWLNPSMPNSPYNPKDPDYLSQKWIASLIHMLLDSEPSVARLTGQTRVEPSQASNGGDITCFEVEATLPDKGLLRQCYYCLACEGEAPLDR